MGNDSVKPLPPLAPDGSLPDLPEKRRGRPPGSKNKRPRVGAASSAEAFSTALARGNTGKDAYGRFIAGNKGGPGNTAIQTQYNKLKSALMKSVSTGDIQAIMRCVIDAAKGGDLNACRLVLDYTVGKAAPPPPDESVLRNAVAVQVNVPLELKGMSCDQIQRMRELDSILAADRGEIQEVAFSTVSSGAGSSEDIDSDVEDAPSAD